MTIFLPIVLLATPQMHGVQPIHVVYVNGADHSAALDRALDWWIRRVDVQFVVDERQMTITDDYLTPDICHDRSWAPTMSAIYILPTYGAFFHCDGVIVLDYTLPGLALVSDGGNTAEWVHLMGHYTGAKDSTNGDIMDYRALHEAWHNGIISDATLAAIGATRRN